MNGLIVVALAGSAVACQLPEMQAPSPAWVSDTSTLPGRSHEPSSPSSSRSSIADRYREAAARIIAEARGGRGAYQKLSELTDKIGHRFSGSPELDRAIAWAVQVMRADGLDVHTEKVMVPHWVRGAEDGEITGPVSRPLHLIGLGGTVSTPKAGITAPVVVVHDWDELEAKHVQVKNAIVLFDVPLPAWSVEHGSGYGDVVQYRGEGPARAAKAGALAVLVRSLTAHSLRSVHTGATHYEDGVTKIPAAAISIEDADLVERLAGRGPVTVRLHLESQMLPDAVSANVIAEWRGTDKPEQVVVISGHIDSWDVGQGAHDDGAGIVTMMEAARVLVKLQLHPHRTIRVVLFTNEENGLRGGKAYAEQHHDELGEHVLALESDSGGFAPRGFSVNHKDRDAAQHARSRISDIATLLAGLGVTHVGDGHGGEENT